MNLDLLKENDFCTTKSLKHLHNYDTLVGLIMHVGFTI